ncbi:sec1 family domain-containing protein 2 [Willisornis vidua]|uniref:Sec1 family domain-containing protein 2 n=1 Tax=Willisornis vidua TaxID=1566151 RepID=A0ABQ9CZ99_9PASS|nr:sec1 family domain-containing protein 2 [Willisornis vidua]
MGVLAQAVKESPSSRQHYPGNEVQVMNDVKEAVLHQEIAQEKNDTVTKSKVGCAGPVKASYKPLLKQVVEEICNPDRLDPVDIEHMSSGLTDLLKTGFSMFMKVNRPHPGDNPLLIIFMVGGVSVSEVKMVKDLVATRKPGTQVIVLSSALLTPHSAVELLFAPDRLQPDTDI